MVKKHVQEMIDKFAPETGLTIDKQSGTIEDFINDEFYAIYAIKGDMKYIRFILANIVEDVSYKMSKSIFKSILTEDESGQQSVSIFVSQEGRFNPNNETFSPGEFPIFSMKILKDNYLEVRVLIQKNMISSYDVELIKSLDEYFHEILIEIDNRMNEQEKLIQEMRTPLFLTTNASLFFEEDKTKEEDKPKPKRRRSNVSKSK